MSEAKGLKEQAKTLEQIHNEYLGEIGKKRWMKALRQNWVPMGC